MATLREFLADAGAEHLLPEFEKQEVLDVETLAALTPADIEEVVYRESERDAILAALAREPGPPPPAAEAAPDAAPRQKTPSSPASPASPPPRGQHACGFTRYAKLLKRKEALLTDPAATEAELRELEKELRALRRALGIEGEPITRPKRGDKLRILRTPNCGEDLRTLSSKVGIVVDQVDDSTGEVRIRLVHNGKVVSVPMHAVEHVAASRMQQRSPVFTFQVPEKAGVAPAVCHARAVRRGVKKDRDRRDDPFTVRGHEASPLQTGARRQRDPARAWSESCGGSTAASAPSVSSSTRTDSSSRRGGGRGGAAAGSGNTFSKRDKGSLTSVEAVLRDEVPADHVKRLLASDAGPWKEAHGVAPTTVRYFQHSHVLVFDAVPSARLAADVAAMIAPLCRSPCGFWRSANAKSTEPEDAPPPPDYEAEPARPTLGPGAGAPKERRSTMPMGEARADRPPEAGRPAGDGCGGGDGPRRGGARPAWGAPSDGSANGGDSGEDGPGKVRSAVNGGSCRPPVGGGAGREGSGYGVVVRVVLVVKPSVSLPHAMRRVADCASSLCLDPSTVKQNTSSHTITFSSTEPEDRITCDLARLSDLLSSVTCTKRYTTISLKLSPSTTFIDFSQQLPQMFRPLRVEPPLYDDSAHAASFFSPYTADLAALVHNLRPLCAELPIFSPTAPPFPIEEDTHSSSVQSPVDPGSTVTSATTSHGLPKRKLKALRHAASSSTLTSVAPSTDLPVEEQLRVKLSSAQAKVHQLQTDLAQANSRERKLQKSLNQQRKETKAAAAAGADWRKRNELFCDEVEKVAGALDTVLATLSACGAQWAQQMAKVGDDEAVRMSRSVLSELLATNHEISEKMRQLNSIAQICHRPTVEAG